MAGTGSQPARRCASGIRSSLAGALLLFAAVSFGAPVPERQAVAWQGRAVADVLDDLRVGGIPLVYSSKLVKPSMRVLAEPAPGKPLRRMREALAPYGLDLREIEGVFVVVRATGTQPEPNGVDGAIRTPASNDTSARQDPSDILQLADLTVSASRYVLFSNAQFYIDQRAIQALPDLGEDPVRSVHRLPGTAASGFSSRSHFRGGARDETAIYLNGLRLTDPFHIRDYHSMFSTIDARAIAGVETFTGGFPADYGDSLSGVLLLESRQPDRPRHTEIGLSVYNTSALLSGHNESNTWDGLATVRRSNLDLFLNDDLGKPDYFDAFGTLGWNLTPRTRLSFNALYAEDRVEVVTESDPAELEMSASRTRNRHLWMQIATDWSPRLSSQTVISSSRLDNRRIAEVNDPEKVASAVHDEREVDAIGIRQDWNGWHANGDSLRWGWEFEHRDADYEYRSQAEYFALFAAWPEIVNPRESVIRAAPEGNAFGAYLTWRWQLLPSTALEPGLRWDHQSYTGSAAGSQLSPRLSLRHELRPGLDLRLSWGRYFQAQGIDELQVEDGVERFFPPQRAEHWIAGVQQRWRGGIRLRAEAFVKRYHHLRPRFENLYDTLALIPELQPDRVRLVPDSARARGVELTLEYVGTDGLNAWATWSWSRVTDRIDARNQARGWDQRHALQAGLAWERGAWQVGLALNWHTGWPTTAVALGYDETGDFYYPIPGPRNAHRLGHFGSIDFRVARQFALRRGSLSAFFEVTNATNRRNECCIDFDIDEDEDGAVFLDRTVEHWLPVIPAVGILWEF